MAYNVNKKARMKDVKNLAAQIKALIDELSGRIDNLEELAEGLLSVTNSVIANIEKGESA